MHPLLSRLSVQHLKAAYHALLQDVLGHVETVKRLDRALDILTRDERYDISVVAHTPLTFRITGPNDSYTVIDAERSCTCPDSNQLCKHRLMVQLIMATVQTMGRDGLHYFTDPVSVHF